MPGGNGNQKGMNRRNHHDSLGQSGQERRAQSGGGYTPPNNNGGGYGLPQYGNDFRTTPTKRDFLGARADEIQRRQKKKRR